MLANVGDSKVVAPRLAARRDQRGVVVVKITGDWAGRRTLSDLAPVDTAFAVLGVSALEFAANQLGRWDSAYRLLGEKLNNRADPLADYVARTLAEANRESVSINPGAIAFTRIPLAANSLAATVVIPTMPHLLAEYGE